MQIQQWTAVEIIEHPDFPALRDEYIMECANAGLPRPQEKLEMYRVLDANESLFCFVAVDGKRLLGFVVVLAPILPHYGRVVAVTESLFVAEKYRKTGAGLRLIRRAEECAKANGSPAMLVSAPIGGKLDALLPRLKYVATNRAYAKEL